MSDTDVSSSSDESDNDCGSKAARKFELARMIDGFFRDEASKNLSSSWTFVMDDGMFERQANFSTTMDLWRHMQQIDTSMTKLRTRSKKGVVRLFRSEFAHHTDSSVKQLWQSGASMDHGGRWLIRFSRKFPFDISDLWVNVVLAAVSDSMPRPDLLAGCVFTTRKGKTEIEVWMQDAIAPSHALAKGSKDSAALSEEQQELQIRTLLNLSPEEKTIQIQYKTHCAERQKKQDLERVRRVQERRDRKGGANTWSHSEPAEKKEEDEQQKLARYRQHIAADSHEQTKAAPVHMYTYNYDDDDEEEAEQELKPPLSALRTPPSSAVFPVHQVAPPPMPTRPLAELQHMQLQGLTIQPDSSDEEEEVEEQQPVAGVNLASLRSRLDSTDATIDLPRHTTAPVVIPQTTDSLFERRKLYDNGVRHCPSERSPRSPNPLALLESEPTLVSRRPTVTGFKSFSPPSKYAMVLGTNPPDFSSPVMKAVLWPVNRSRRTSL